MRPEVGSSKDARGTSNIAEREDASARLVDEAIIRVKAREDARYNISSVLDTMELRVGRRVERRTNLNADDRAERHLQKLQETAGMAPKEKARHKARLKESYRVLRQELEYSQQAGDRKGGEERTLSFTMLHCRNK
ncbi:hypothetical protein QCA50_012599 [Cerrena zonata]|uniref:Uncharacterized protein n=1 Tax=Cerrena zonata TaxID=2478898 RepID=A0AAW0FZJ6_9APHY